MSKRDEYVRRCFWEPEQPPEEFPNDITRWRPALPEELLTVVSVATGQVFVVRVADHLKIGRREKVAVLEQVAPGKYLERVFLGSVLEFSERCVEPRLTAEWADDLCTRPVDGRCLCELPHRRDNSERVAAFSVGQVVPKMYERGVVFFEITRVDSSGAWGRVVPDRMSEKGEQR